MSEDIQRRIPNGMRGPEIQFELDGEPAVAYEGETIAAVLLALGIRKFRVSPKEKEPRGLYCGMGVCFECIVTVNDELNVRACMTTVEDGMKVETGATMDKRPTAGVKE